MSLEVGAAIPEFSLKDKDGKKITVPKDLEGNAAVLFFYPKNFTPGCTREACSFRDAFQDFTDLGVKVIGISSDSESSHQKFTNKFELPYTLLSDSKNKVRKLFGVKNKMLGLLPGRETFVFDSNGKLVYKFESLDATPHIKKSLAFLQKNQ
ncbi:peroxiredoxin [Jejudonia soesokkakensis]|uniref:thioredoxin-dependent peroxiredoxin n=1 Tax=Jejudonia soesokkakensis TaxID=1323432 RepID=A0ABW2MQE8_9FLAO